jgi:hypothetical protein
MGLYSTLSTGGRAIVLSTPNGIGDKYHELCVQAQNAENEFNFIKLMWDVHPERDDEWFNAETKNMSPKQIAQELMCDFAASGDTFLSSEDLQRFSLSIKTPIERWGPEMCVWVWKYSLTDNKYIISADIARGDASDYSAFHVIDITTSEQVCEYKGKVPPDQFALLLAEAGKRYNEALICPENNTYGYATIMKLVEIGYKNLYFKNEKDRYASLYGINTDISKIGFQTNAQSRGKILTKFEQVIRNSSVSFYSSRLHQELKTFIWKGQKAQAQKGKNDDLVISAAIGTWLFDADPKRNHQTTDLNKAMLKGFAVNQNEYGQKNSKAQWPHLSRFPLTPYRTPKEPGAKEGEDFKWLI